MGDAFYFDMNYKLAKQLKDAGFPQEKKKLDGGDYISDPKCMGDCEPSCIAYIPTLSELIKACGNGFENLSSIRGSWFANYDGWRVKIIDVKGKTPEEAVAKLWLKLNKKPNVL